jgi:hypothetical protein
VLNTGELSGFCRFHSPNSSFSSFSTHRHSNDQSSQDLTPGIAPQRIRLPRRLEHQYCNRLRDATLPRPKSPTAHVGHGRVLHGLLTCGPPRQCGLRALDWCPPRHVGGSTRSFCGTDDDENLAPKCRRVTAIAVSEKSQTMAAGSCPARHVHINTSLRHGISGEAHVAAVSCRDRPLHSMRTWKWGCPPAAATIVRPARGMAVPVYPYFSEAVNYHSDVVPSHISLCLLWRSLSTSLPSTFFATTRTLRVYVGVVDMPSWGLRVPQARQVRSVLRRSFVPRSLAAGRGWG